MRLDGLLSQDLVSALEEIAASAQALIRATLDAVNFWISSGSHTAVAGDLFASGDEGPKHDADQRMILTSQVCPAFVEEQRVVGREAKRSG